MSPTSSRPSPTGRPSGWVQIPYPGQVRTQPRELAQFCGWKIRKRTGEWEVCTTERYQHQTASLLRSVCLTTASTADRRSAYKPVTGWRRQDELAPDFGPMVRDELQRLEKLGTREAFWAAFQLDIMTTPSSHIELALQGWYQRIAAQMQESSLWAIELHPWLLSRQSVIRTLFSAAETPEMLNRPMEEFDGFKSARGLMDTSGMGGIGTFIEIPLTVIAPWLLGIATRRVGGLVVVLFGNLEDGHGPGPADDMLQLYRPRLLAMATREALPRPEVTAAQAESLLRWWVQRLNEFFEVVLDPANYRVQADWSYDPRSHLGTLLTVDRLLACVLGVLVDTGRNEFIRKLLLFDTLDLLDGLYQGGYDQLCKHSVVEQRLMLLTETLPPDIGSLLLPRCQRAADALHSLQDGFFLTERLGSTGLQMQRPKGTGLQTKPLEGATAAYLRVVRNASHSFRDMIRKAPDDISLLAAHDGELPAELADLAFLHFLYLLVAPTTLLPGWLRKAK